MNKATRGGTRATKKSRARESVNAYRTRMMRQGFRLMQVWVPDVHAPRFAKEFARQTAMAGKLSKDDEDFLDAALVDALPGWEP